MNISLINISYWLKSTFFVIILNNVMRRTWIIYSQYSCMLFFKFLKLQLFIKSIHSFFKKYIITFKLNISWSSGFTAVALYIIDFSKNTYSNLDKILSK